MLWWDRVPFEILSSVCDDYVDNIFSVTLCLVVRERKRESPFLWWTIVWHQMETRGIKIVWQQWGELFICKHGRIAPASPQCFVCPKAFRWLVRCVAELGVVCFPLLTPSVRASEPIVWCFCHLCAHNKLWPVFNQRLLDRTKRRLCQTEGTAATTVLEY